MATDYTSQINAIQQSVSYTNASAGDLAVYNAELNNGTSLAQVAQQIVNSSFVTAVVDPVIALYQGAFGRVPDAAGLKAEVQAVEAGVPLAPRSATDNSSLVFQFANSPEFTARYGVTALSPSSPALVQLLYQNVLGRAPDAAGLAYWTAQPLNAQQLLAAFSLPSLDPEYSARVSQQVKSFEYDETGQAGSQPTPTMGSLFQVPVNQGATNGPGGTFQFTTSVDNLQGTNGNDTFTGDNTGATPTVTAGDTANGGAGTDTFNYFIPAAGALGTTSVVIPQLNSVEIVNFIGGSAPALGTETFDLSATTGVTNVNLKNQTFGAQAVTVANGTTVGFDNVKFAAGTDTVNFAATATNGSLAFTNGDALNTLTVTGAALTSLNLNSTGAANTVTTLNTAAGVTSLSITADQALTVTNALSVGVNTIDGSSATGALKLTLGATTAITDSIKTGSGADVVSIANVGADSVTVALGTGNDTLKVGGALAGFTTGTSLDGGDGTDIINLTAGFTAANLAVVKNFETLDLSGAAGGTSVDASVTTGTGAFTSFQADAGISGTHGALTLTNIASGFTFSEISAKGANESVNDTFTLKADTANDSFVLNLTSVDGNNDGAANGLINATVAVGTAAAPVENLTINANITTADTGVLASAYVETVALTESGLTSLTITGNESLNIGAPAVGTATFTTINASASTGNITLDLSSFTPAESYAGSAGVDTFKGGSGGLTFYGAGGNDQVTLNTAHTAADVLVFKAGTDASLTTSGSVVSTTSTTETYTNFQSISDAAGKAAPANAHDTIDVSGIGGFTGFANGVKTISGVDPLSGTFAASQNGFFSDVGGNRGAVVDEAGGNTYVFVDANHDGNFNAATDLVIKIAGTGHAISAADFNFG